MRIAGVHFALPLALLYAAVNVPFLGLLVIFQPDVGYWLEAAAGVVLVKGILEVSPLWRTATRFAP